MARRHNAKGRSTFGPPFIQLYHHVKRSAAYYSLSVYARSALIELLDVYTGANNGSIVMSVRELSERLRCNPRTAMNALQELDDAGLIRPTRMGGFRRGGNFASEWRLMFYRDDRTGDLPVKKWPPAEHCTTYNAPVAPRTLRKCSNAASSAPDAMPTAETTEIRSAPRTTHVDIYHRGTGEGADTAPATPPPAASRVGPATPRAGGDPDDMLNAGDVALTVLAGGERDGA